MNFPMQIFSNPSSIEEQLGYLGLTSESLRTAVSEGQAARNIATANHPANAGGTFAYLEVVRSLRDQLIPKGWEKKNIQNLSMTINKNSNVAVAVSGGSKETGQPEGYPTTRNSKGETTKKYLDRNQQELNLFPIPITPEDPNDQSLQTWLLLYYCDRRNNEVRLELSLPTDTDVYGKVCGWKTRILLKPIPLDGEEIKIEPDYSPDIDIDVRLKA